MDDHRAPWLPGRFLSIVIQLHKYQRDQVRLNSDFSGSFPIVNGVKLSCVLALTLFSIIFIMILKYGIESLEDDGAVYICNGHERSLFNPRRLHAYTKTLEQLFRDLLIADVAALVAHIERDLQRITSCFAEAAHLFGLEVSFKKTEVRHKHLPTHINIGGTELKTVRQFTYLGCTSHQIRISTEK